MFRNQFTKLDNQVQVVMPSCGTNDLTTQMNLNELLVQGCGDYWVLIEIMNR